MAFTVKTIVKLFIMFLVFQISINFLVEFIPNNIATIDNKDLEYLDFVRTQTNGNLVAEDTGNSLLDNFVAAMTKEDFFNDSLVDKFLGVLQVIGQMFLFIFQVALQILFTPTIIMEILLYNFIFSSTILFSVSLAVNIFFYMTLFYIVSKRRIQS